MSAELSGRKEKCGYVVTRRWGLCSVAVLAIGSLMSLVACGGASRTSLGSQPPPSGNQVSVSISPPSANVTSGGSVQFSAAVSGTSNAQVVWTTTAGSISASGLLTAPAVRSATNITVSATSVANSQEKASAAVDVAAPPTLTITTASLASATVGQAYDANLSAKGGEQPYQWNILSGALPAGVQLNTQSGALSGAPTQTGKSDFTVAIADQVGQTAQQNLSLLVTAASACGPPSYPCSRSDLDAVVPTAPPQLGSDTRYYGGHSGAGSVAIDPAYGNRILRVTDGETDPNTPGTSYVTSWSAEANLISADESLFFAVNEGGAPCLFDFDQAAFRATFHGCRYGYGNGNLQFGYTQADANAFYTYAGAYLYRFVIDRGTFAISADSSFNHGKGRFNPDSHLCLDGQLAALGTWYAGDTSLSSDDATFVVDLGPEQDVNPYVVVWNATKGCRWLNVNTWEVSQGWNTGLANPVKISWVSGNAPTRPGGMHNVQLDRSGQYAILAINNTSLKSKVFWDVDTNVVNDTCTQCQSHWACDFGVCFWDFGPYDQGFLMRDMAILPSADMSALYGQRDMVTTPSNSSRLTNDEHAAHQNASANQKNIYLVEWGKDSGAFTVENNWDDEILGVNWDGSKRTIRFNKTWNSSFAGGCPISPLGHYAICASDYQMYNKDKGFGNGLNEDSCDHNMPETVRGTNGCRSDILLFELR